MIIVCAASLCFSLPANGQADPADLWKKYLDAAFNASVQKRDAEAEELFRVALKLAEGFGPSDTRLARTLNLLGGQYTSKGHYDQAIELHKRALAVSERAGEAGKMDLVASLSNLAMILQAKGRHAEAESHYARALEVARSRASIDPDLYLNMLGNVAQYYFTRQKYAEAEPLLNQLLPLSKSPRRQGQHLEPYGVIDMLARVYAGQGRHADAERVLMDYIAEQEALGKVDVRLGLSLRQLGEYFREQGEYEEAVFIFERAIEICVKAEKSEGEGALTAALWGQAEVYRLWGFPDKAEELLLRAMEIELESESYIMYFPMSLIGLGNLYREQGRLEELEPLARRALQIQEAKMGAEHPLVADSLASIASYLVEFGKYSDAESLYLRAIKIQEKTLGPDHPELANTLHSYASLLRKMNREAEATKISDRVQEIRSRETPVSPE